MNETVMSNSIPPPTLLGSYSRRQLLARLQDALLLARDDAGDLPQLREVLGDATERVDALLLTQVHPNQSVQPLSRLKLTALAAAHGNPVEEFLLVPFGEVQVERPAAGGSFVFTQQHAESAQRWFEQMGRKLAIDYEHQSFDRLNARSDGLKPAAGWIGGLEVRDDGLWAIDVTWTDRARELLSTGEYRYFSPVIYWADEDQQDVAALGPVALTNDPAMHGVRPLAATRQANADAETAEPTADSGDEELRLALSQAQDEVVALRRELAAQEADSFVERGLRQGKILESTSLDWRADYLRDPEATIERLSRAPVLLPPGRLVCADASGRVQPAPRTRVVASQGFGTQLAPEAEDLAAYEQAVAAGRVLTRHG